MSRQCRVTNGRVSLYDAKGVHSNSKDGQFFSPISPFILTKRDLQFYRITRSSLSYGLRSLSTEPGNNIFFSILRSQFSNVRYLFAHPKNLHTLFHQNSPTPFFSNAQGGKIGGKDSIPRLCSSWYKIGPEVNFK